MIAKKYIVITREATDGKAMQKQLEALGFNVFHVPSITVSKNILTEDAKKNLEHVSSFDWIIFTSRNGVRFFMEALSELHIHPSTLRNNIAAVGPKTAEEVKKYDLPVHVIPSEFTTEDLAQALPNITGKKILLPRANIATPLLTEALEKKGAVVMNIALYTTQFTKTSTHEFTKHLENSEILCITFTSPSTVEGFLKNIEGLKEYHTILSLPVLSIGPITTEALKHHNFQRIYTADTFTIEGMITKLKESIL